MSPVPDRPIPRRRTGLLLASLAIALAVATGVAAVRPKVESPHGKLREECATCHTADSWKIAKVKSSFDHSKYGFRLAGAHAAAGCVSCHGSLEFAKTASQCATCHTDPHRGELGSECARCHGDRSFLDRGPMVRAHQMTQFPLTGGHAALDCESCHRPAAQGKMQFVGTQAQCQDCHMAQYQSAKTPDHAAGHYPLECQTCHSTVSWEGARFNHDATGFPLTGSHRATACASCHTNGRFAGTARACESCHMTQYNAASPNHLASGFAASACASCHNTTSWDGANFDHNTTSFALTGAHRASACNDCHSDGVYDGKPTACFSCHSSDYTSASPAHSPGSFPQDQCATCHTTTSWDGANFDHGATAFALTGAHTTTACASCHVGAVYAGTSRECQGCHMTQFNAATPNHLASGFSASACASCHTTTTWDGANFDHNTTSFALTGAHRASACNDCHSDGVYDGKPTACFSCHASDYTGASPPHTPTGFPQDQCATCHTTTSWDAANFNHSATAFPLTGAHTATACASCHVGGVYAGTSRECQGCHMPDYNAATPDHPSAGFTASACLSCHNTTQWAGATFDHDGPWFPIYTGKHRGKWDACTDCHTNPANYTVFTCLSCHPHSDKADTDNEHDGERGYQYESNACYSCHPRGNS